MVSKTALYYKDDEDYPVKHYTSYDEMIFSKDTKSVLEEVRNRYPDSEITEIVVVVVSDRSYAPVNRLKRFAREDGGIND